LSAFTLFTVYSYKVVLVHSAVVTLYSPANPSTVCGAGGGKGYSVRFWVGVPPGH